MKLTVKSRKRAIKASSTADMLDAFEERLSELNVGANTCISASTDDRSVDISRSDYDMRYEDVEGGFGEPGAIYSLGEIKEYWNKENSSDPVLVDYASYSEWWNDTLNNFLEETD